MKVVIHSNEPLVFRDGRPFGDAGHVDGGALRWPLPFTVSGLLRNRIGNFRSPDYFSGSQRAFHIEEIKKVAVIELLPLWRRFVDDTSWHPLFPVPADALLFPAGEKDRYDIESFNYSGAFAAGCGTDLSWKNWLLPMSSRRDKPAVDAPELWHQEPFFTWLETGCLPESISARDLGFNLPQTEMRMHSAIDPETGSVKTGQLFSSQGISLLTAANDRQAAGRFGIGATLANLQDKDDPSGPCFFGGERKTARIDRLNDSIPNLLPLMPEWLKQNARFLRLILVSPGDFGSWAPDWLRPDPDASETAWCKIPTTEFEIRLVSAFIPRWQPVSGWDYDKRGPKATRKLVPAGAVYVVELKKPETAGSVAELLWGRSLNGSLQDPDGCGTVCVGKLCNVE